MGIGEYFKLSAENKFVTPGSKRGEAVTQGTIAALSLVAGTALVYAFRAPDQTLSSFQLLSHGAKRGLIPFALTEVALNYVRSTRKAPSKGKLEKEIEELKTSEAKAKADLETANKDKQRVQDQLAALQNADNVDETIKEQIKANNERMVELEASLKQANESLEGALAAAEKEKQKAVALQEEVDGLKAELADIKKDPVVPPAPPMPVDPAPIPAGGRLESVAKSAPVQAPEKPESGEESGEGSDSEAV